MKTLVWHCGYSQWYANDSTYAYVVTQVEKYDEYYWAAAYRLMGDDDDEEDECLCHKFTPVPGPFSVTARQAKANVQAFSEEYSD